MKLKNNVARYGWWFSACFLLMCIAFTYILIRDGASHIQIYPPTIPDHYPPWVMPAVLSLFWAAGLGLASYMAGLPCVHVEVDFNGVVRIHKRYPFKKEYWTLQLEEIAAVDLVEGKDAEGDSYYTVRLIALDDFFVDIAEGSDKRRCIEVQAKFKAALAKAADGR